jgi:hypothetical protein
MVRRRTTEHLEARVDRLDELIRITEIEMKCIDDEIEDLRKEITVLNGQKVEWNVCRDRLSALCEKAKNALLHRKLKC